VRLVGPSGEQVGIVPLAKALELAQEYDLDLVEVAATARPPVCKLMDYGKFKYESAMKAREARKNQAHTVIKEMKLRPKIDPHDYDTKKGHVVRFLKQGDKVMIMVLGPHKKKTEAMAEAREAAAIRKAERQGRPAEGDEAGDLDEQVLDETAESAESAEADDAAADDVVEAAEVVETEETPEAAAS
jgi:translation initiation factor IF-3